MKSAFAPVDAHNAEHGIDPTPITPEFVKWLDTRDEPIVLRELDHVAIAETAEWLTHPNNYKWLDFGNGRQILNSNALSLMARSGAHCLRSCHDATDRLVGIAALSHVDNAFKSAMLWGVRMRVRPPSRSNAVHQIRQIMAVGFRELGLQSIYCWVVDINRPSIATVKACGMREVGRQRRAHVIDGVYHDRFLFDILVDEFEQQEQMKAAHRAAYSAASPEEEPQAVAAAPLAAVG